MNFVRISEKQTVGATVSTLLTSYPATSNKPGDVKTNGAVTRTFAHDAAGNVVTDARGGTAFTYVYNNAGRLAQAKKRALTGTYVYDGLERLAIRTVANATPAGTTHLIYDTSGRVIAETNGAGKTTREYVWLETAAFAANDNDPGGGRLGAAESASDPFSPAQLPSLALPRPWRDAPALPLAVIDNPASAPAILYVHADHLNRPVKMTNAAKASVWDAVYKPFGETHVFTGAATLNPRFPGQHFQFETGLAYNGTGITMRRWAGTRSPIRWAWWMGRVCMRMRVGLQRRPLTQQGLRQPLQFQLDFVHATLLSALPDSQQSLRCVCPRLLLAVGHARHRVTFSRSTGGLNVRSVLLELAEVTQREMLAEWPNEVRHNPPHADVIRATVNVAAADERCCYDYREPFAHKNHVRQYENNGVRFANKMEN